MPRWIIIKNKRYYYYDTYTNSRKMLNEAKYWRSKIGSRWFIIKREGFTFGNKVYDLYLTKIGGLG